jgi:hypothetical protein
MATFIKLSSLAQLDLRTVTSVPLGQLTPEERFVLRKFARWGLCTPAGCSKTQIVPLTEAGKKSLQNS